jgi:hypothetical protein
VRCNPGGVVIVKGFQGHFAKPWPRALPICGTGTAPSAIHESAAKLPLTARGTNGSW